MSNSKKGTKIGFGCLLLAAILLPICYFGLTHCIYRVSGEPFFDSARDRAKLQRIAETYDPVIAAIEKHGDSHGEYPADLDGLDVGMEGVRQAKSFLGERNHTVYYHVVEGGFMLQIKLNWDGGLNYKSRSGQWRYDPGNGDPDWPIHETTSH